MGGLTAGCFQTLLSNLEEGNVSFRQGLCDTGLIRIELIYCNQEKYNMKCKKYPKNILYQKVIQEISFTAV